MKYAFIAAIVAIGALTTQVSTSTNAEAGACVQKCHRFWCPTRFRGSKPVFGHWEFKCSCNAPTSR